MGVAQGQTLSIPERWDDINPEWMSAALARSCPGAKVSKVTLIERDDGTNRRGRMAIDYAEGQGPARVFLKGHDPAHTEVHMRNGNFVREARIFNSDAPLQIEHPQTYCALLELDPPARLVVMEDVTLRGADPKHGGQGLTPDQVASGLKQLARLHSQFWNYSTNDYPGLAWLDAWAVTDGWKVGLGKRVPIGLERGAVRLPKAVTRFTGNEIVGFWARYVSTLAIGATTLLHADAHLGNTYVLPDGTVGFLDWQTVRRGAWHQDAGYFLQSALTEADRRAHQAELLEIYRTALDVPEAERPSKEAAWLAYRASAIYGLAIWVSTMGTDGWQKPEISLALASRFAAAFEELDTLSALAEIGV